ncbi:MAG: hypothetical protein JSR33_08845 [Proteobacteria bacterium]|nr:hypothetical protein [Pseudomonadota bacterium]
MAGFRFYEELNDFLAPEFQKQWMQYPFRGNPSVKDAIEALGVAHVEVDLIIVNGNSVGFEYQLQNGDSISVYPVFESLDITPLVHCHPKPLRKTQFILNVHLGTLSAVPAEAKITYKLMKY